MNIWNEPSFVLSVAGFVVAATCAVIASMAAVGARRTSRRQASEIDFNDWKMKCLSSELDRTKMLLQQELEAKSLLKPEGDYCGPTDGYVVHPVTGHILRECANCRWFISLGINQVGHCHNVKPDHSKEHFPVMDPSDFCSAYETRPQSILESFQLDSKNLM